MIFKKPVVFSAKGLRIEKSLNSSGVILNEQLIEELKPADYCVKTSRLLDGDAPKQFIKAYFHGDNPCVKKQSANSWCAYIAKTAEKWYPVESVVEYMINRIGQVMGLHMNDVRLVKANTQIRFLSRYFLAENEQLIHGAEICGAFLEDMSLAEQIANDKLSARELFTFEFIRRAMQTVFPKDCERLLDDLVKMVVFDAIVGNNDRHFYNWGIIDSIKKSKKPPKFAPLYDSARGLLWNASDSNVAGMMTNHAAGGKKIVQYIHKAAPRISFEGNSEVNHFELVHFLIKEDAGYKATVRELSTEALEAAVLKMLKREFYVFFVPVRSEAISLILKERFAQIRRLL